MKFFIFMYFRLPNLYNLLCVCQNYFPLENKNRKNILQIFLNILLMNKTFYALHKALDIYRQSIMKNQRQFLFYFTFAFL